VIIEDDEAYIKECVRNTIGSLCDDLDFLISPDIEEKMSCSLDCCIGNNTWPWIERMIDNKDIQIVVGEEGLELLRQLDKRLHDAIYYDDEIAFSKTERWLEFVEFATKVNSFLKGIRRGM
jgi:hypothetical protein